MNPRPVVCKVGGSLLDLPDLPERLRDRLVGLEWPALLVGGGPVADFVRHADRRFGLGEAVAHELALRSLDVTAHTVAALLRPRAVVCEGIDPIRDAWSRGGWPVVAAREFLQVEPLPASWDVTSDSIAARLAARLGAELWLFKSVGPIASAPQSPERLVALGYVDAYFPTACRGLATVRTFNLRAVEGQAAR